MTLADHVALLVFRLAGDVLFWLLDRHLLEPWSR
jgi:hypothetical protein